MSTNETSIKKAKFFALNIVLAPTESQYPGRYVELLDKIYETKYTHITYTDKASRIRTLYHGEDIVYGEIANFSYIDPKKPGIDLATNEPITLESYDLNQAPNLKNWNFYFIPSAHKLFFEDKSGVSVSQIVKFLYAALNKVCMDFESVEVAIITSKEIIESIINASALTSLEISLTYSNNDNYPEWLELFDEEFREGDVRTFAMAAKGTKKKPFKLIRVFKALLELSRRNGKAKATILENNSTKFIDTDDHPQSNLVEYYQDNDLREKLVHLASNE